MVTDRERLLWQRYNALLTTVPGMIDERMRAVTGVSRFHFMLLETIREHPDGSVQLAAVARATDSSLSRLSHAIDRLVEQGLVERRTSSDDRRASWAVLTPEGKRVVDEGREAFERLMHEVLISRIPEEQHEAAITVLTSLLPPDVAAYLSTISEHVFPVLLFVGLASRLSALTLFGMTMVIQLFVVPGGWPEHILWLSLLTLIMARGPGPVSLDHLIWHGRLAAPALTHREA